MPKAKEKKAILAI